MVIHDSFIQGMQHMLVCVVKDKNGHSRIAEPYGVFLTRHGKPMYCCYQLTGHTESKQVPGWRNLPVTDVEEVLLTERSFKKRKDFNPDNQDVYHQWVDSI